MLMRDTAPWTWAWQDQGRARPSLGAVDAWRHDDQVVVALDLPGIDPGSVEVTLEGDLLTVKAERPAQWGTEASVLVNERRSGTVVRRLRLGRGLDPANIQAQADQGVLTIIVPVAERARARRVTVASGSAHVALDEAA